MKIDKRNIVEVDNKSIIIAVLMIVLLFSFTRCSENKKVAKSNNIALTENAKVFKNKIGTLTTEKRVLQIERNELKDLVFVQDTTINKLRKELNRVSTITKIVTITKIDSVYVPFNTELPYDTIRVGKHAKKYFKFDYSVTSKGLSLTNINIPNEQIVINGFKRNGIFGKKYLITQITNTNPYISTTNVQTIKVIVPTPFYDTRLFNIGIGFIGGVLLAK